MRPRVILAGYLARFAMGGYVWQALHYLLGFRALGCDVFFYEGTDFLAGAYDPTRGSFGPSYDYGLAAARQWLERFGFADRWAFWEAEHNALHGLSEAATRELFASADLLVNLAGVNRPERWPRPAVTAFVDIDPAYTQIKLESGDAVWRDFVTRHDLHFTIGENIGTARSPLPSGGLRWRPTRPPIVCDLWETALNAEAGAFTTIGKWDEGHRDMEFRGETYGWRKSREWVRFLDLPLRSAERFELAMDVTRFPQDLERLQAHGWGLRDPLPLSVDPEAYRRYIQTSKGEFSAAKDMNVRLRSGWFSDRSVCYLAAGRPTVLQDTGFSDSLPAGLGLHAVRDCDEAVAAVARIRDDYAAESRAARAIARECFEASRVLRPILEAAGLKEAA